MGIQKLLQVLLGLVLALFLVGSAVWGTLAFRPLYYYDIAALDIGALSGYSETEIRANYDALIDYNLSWKQEPLALPTLPISEQGRIHFQEVKAIFEAFRWMVLLAIPLLLRGILYSRKNHCYDWLGLGALCAVALPLIVGVGVVFWWEQAFVLFHKLFFRNDYWLFDPLTDPVILILPDGFFFHSALLLVTLVLLESAACFLLWRRLRRS